MVNNPLQEKATDFYFWREMSVYIKRLILLIAVVILAVGVRLFDNGLCSLGLDGKYSYYSSDDEVTKMSKVPLFCARGKYERIDLAGDYAYAERIIKRARASVIKEESLDGVTVIYAYSPTISNFTVVSGKKVNLMIAVSDEKIAVGSPLLKGSY